MTPLKVAPVPVALLAMGAAVAGTGAQAVVLRPTAVAHLPRENLTMLLL